MKKLHFAIIALLLASIVFAQNETFTLRQGLTPFVRGTPDPNYPWPNFYESERFIIRYTEDRTHGAYVTRAAAQSALETLERSYDTITTKYNFVTPFHPTANTRFKSEVSISRLTSQNTSGQTAWADGNGTAYGGLLPGQWNTSASTVQRPIQWISQGMSATTLTHEWAHGLQQMSGGMRDSDFVGWFHESHAQWVTSHVHGGTSGGLTASRVTMRQAHLHPGYARSRYENWPFLEHIWNSNGGGTAGWAVINNIWTRSPGPGSNDRRQADPFEWIQRGNPTVYPNWASIGDLFGNFAMRSVIYDYGPRRATFRSNYNATNISESERYQRYTYLEALGINDFAATNNRYVSPHAYAPQRLAFNIIRLYPEAGGNWNGGTVTVRFRGDVQTANNRPNYSQQSGFDLEPSASNVHNNPGSAWRYGLVAVAGDAAATANTVTARYSQLMRTDTSGTNRGAGPDVSITLQSGETQLYLVVTAAPTANHKLKWDQYHYTTYRFPYMVEINGAKPEGFQAPPSNITWRIHSNGGGSVASTVTVPASVFVAPNARIYGGNVSGNARIEGRAVIRGGTVRGNAIIRDYASVRSGTVEGDAVVSNGATIWGATVQENARVHGSALLTGGTVRGTAQVGGAAVISGGTISGTAQALGDAFGSLTQSSGIWYAAGSGASSDPRGSQRTTVPIEFTKPLSRTWYGDSGSLSSSSATPSSSSATPSSSSATPSSSSVAPSSSSNIPSSSSVTPSSSSVTVTIIPSSSSGGDSNNEVSSSSVVQSSSSTDITNIYNVATPSARAFDMNNRGIFHYNLGDINSARLKIYDSRGNLLKTMQLSGTAGAIDTGLRSSVVFWKVEGNNGKLIQQTRMSTVR
ncbi:MAG: DUF6055 domain-containing protein [Fibromonadaceae bacterium]|jgi:carbonic anhydrase/acetyltransferase-like protein (isoleucine patch superfamily)|nr:DUF6055 domain-containing protein [Fibromonadaceae bacterium]